RHALEPRRHRAKRGAKAERAKKGEGSSPGTIQMNGNSLEHSARRPAAAFHKISRLLAHLFHTLRIAKQFNPCHAYILGTFNLNSRPRRNETRSDFRKILHRRPKNRNLPERRWFQNVMASGGHQRATHKSAVRQPIKRCEFPDAINKEHGDIVRYRGIARVTVPSSSSLRGTRNRQCRASDELAMRFLDELRGGAKLLGLPRRKHQQRIAVFTLQRSKRNQRQR